MRHTKQLCCGHFQPFCGTVRMYAHPIEVMRGHEMQRIFKPAFSGGRKAGGMFLHCPGTPPQYTQLCSCKVHHVGSSTSALFCFRSAAASQSSASFEANSGGTFPFAGIFSSEDTSDSGGFADNLFNAAPRFHAISCPLVPTTFMKYVVRFTGSNPQTLFAMRHMFVKFGAPEASILLENSPSSCKTEVTPESKPC